MVDAVVDWVGPVRLEERVETVAVCEVDFGTADSCDTGVAISIAVRLELKNYLR